MFKIFVCFHFPFTWNSDFINFCALEIKYAIVSVCCVCIDFLIINKYLFNFFGACTWYDLHENIIMHQDLLVCMLVQNYKQHSI